MTSTFSKHVTVAIGALLFGAVMGVIMPPVAHQTPEVSAKRA